MSEIDYKIGSDHASKNWQASPPDPQKTWEQNNAARRRPEQRCRRAF